MNYKLVKNDALKIIKRIKQINKNYLIKYNLTKKRYELFFKQGRTEVLELVLPFKSLDKRTIDHLLKTRVQNLNNLIKEIETKNQLIETNNKKAVLDEAKIKLNEMAKYTFKKGDNSNLSFENSYKTKWV